MTAPLHVTSAVHADFDFFSTLWLAFLFITCIALTFCDRDSPGISLLIANEQPVGVLGLGLNFWLME